MFIAHGTRKYPKAPEGRHVCRVGLMHDKSIKSLCFNYKNPLSAAPHTEKAICLPVRQR